MALSYSCSSKGIEIRHYTDTDWAAECAWHLYWQERDYATLDSELASAAPPAPPSPSRSTKFTWAELRKAASDGGARIDAHSDPDEKEQRVSATAEATRPKGNGRKPAAPAEPSAERVGLIQSWDAETLATFIADTPGDDPELVVAVNALDAMQQKLVVDQGADDEPDEVTRLRTQADDKDAKADNLVDNGDDEGAQILRIEAEALRSDAEAKLSKFREEAGEAVGAMPPANNLPPEDPDPDPEVIVVAGIKMDYPNMGGKSPTRAMLTLVDPKALLQDGTGFLKGQRIKFSGEAIVNHVSQKDHRDAASGIVASAEQQHRAQIVDLRVEAV